MKKPAFTLLELIFVIVVIGILAATFIPKFSANKLTQAANQVVSDIRYTQHLALVDDKYDSTDQYWYRQRWQIAFSTANQTVSYMIMSDEVTGTGNYNGNPIANNTYSDVSIAVNPENKNLYMIGIPYSTFNNSDTNRLSTKLDLGKTYGITNISITGGSTGSSAKRILFDHLGRPYRGTDVSLTSPQDHVATSPIDIKLTNTSGSIKIQIEPETGYVHIL